MYTNYCVKLTTMAKVSFTLRELNMVIRACKIELSEGIKRMDNKQYEDLEYATKKLVVARDTQYTRIVKIIKEAG